MVEAAESCVPDGLVDLPTDLLAAVLAQLDARDVGRSAQTCTILRDATHHAAILSSTALGVALPPLYPGEGVASALRWCAAFAANDLGGRTIAAGASHSLAASADGATFVWGGCAPGWDHDDDAPAVGFLGLGELDDIEAAGDTGLAIVTRPRRVDLWKETAVAEVCAGSTHSVAVDRRGGAWCWGVEYTGHPAGTHGHPDAVEVRRSGPDDDDDGDDVVRADGGGAPCSRPTPLALGVRIVGASCGAFHTLLLAEGGVLLSFGRGAEGQLGHGDRRDRATPTVVETERLVKESGRRLRLCDVSAGAEHSVAVSDDGVAYTWGDGLWGQLGDDKQRWHRDAPTLGQAAVDTATAGVASVVPLTKVVRDDVVRRWAAPAAVEGALTDVFVVGASAGGSHTLFFGHRRGCTEGPNVLYSCGSGALGKLGLGDERDRHLPTLVTEGCTPLGVAPTATDRKAFGGDSVKQACAGDEHSVVLTTTGRVYTFGCGSNGRCGPGYWNRLYPDRVAVDRDVVVEIAAGEEHTLARAADGTLYAFGANGSGQLGIGGTVDEDIPEEVALP